MEGGKYRRRSFVSSVISLFTEDLSLFSQARDFFLIITLCFGIACAGILVLRPTFMALFGYGTLGGRLEYD